MRRPVLRAGAALVALVLLAGAVFGWSLILLGGAISAQRPDPAIPDGDPCCTHPDTWDEVAEGVGWTLGYVVLDGFLIAAAIALLSWSARGTWPRVRRLLLVPAGGLLLGLVVFAALLVPLLAEA